MNVVTNEQVKIVEVLTGYIEERLIKTIQRREGKIINRFIDIGYRSMPARFWLGRHGMLKSEIAEKFVQITKDTEIKTDISTDYSETLYGKKWYEFMLNAKYTIGVEGGASILDKDGKIKEKTEQYQMKNPDAGYEEIAENCFKNEEGKLELFCLSPRHLEACVTKTCQILVEGNYNNILLPEKHYIPLKKDFSNIGEILEVVKTDKIRREIVDQAYNDIVKSGQYTYRKFIESVLKETFQGHESKEERGSSRPLGPFLKEWLNIADKYSWIYKNIRSYVRSLLALLVPEKCIKKIDERLRYKITN